MSIDNNAVKLVQMNTTCFVNLFSAWNYDRRKKLKSAKWIPKASTQQKETMKVKREPKSKHTHTAQLIKKEKRIIGIYESEQGETEKEIHMQGTHTHEQPIQQQQWSFRFLFSLFSRNRHPHRKKHTLAFIGYSLFFQLKPMLLLFILFFAAPFIHRTIVFFVCSSALLQKYNRSHSVSTEYLCASFFHWLLFRWCVGIICEYIRREWATRQIRFLSIRITLLKRIKIL